MTHRKDRDQTKRTGELQRNMLALATVRQLGDYACRLDDAGRYGAVVHALSDGNRSRLPRRLLATKYTLAQQQAIKAEAAFIGEDAADTSSFSSWEPVEPTADASPDDSFLDEQPSLVIEEQWPVEGRELA